LGDGGATAWCELIDSQTALLGRDDLSADESMIGGNRRITMAKGKKSKKGKKDKKKKM